MKKLILLICMIFLISNVSAFLDIKEFNPDIPQYGEINIKDWVFLKKADYRLTDYDASVINVWAEGEYKLHKKTHLFTGVFYKDALGRQGSLRDVKFFIWVNETSFIDVNDYEEQCEDKLVNGSTENICENVLIGTHQEIRSHSYWKEYNKGDELEESEGRWRLEAKRKPNKPVDFVLEAHGKTFDEWAWWNANWRKKRKINTLDTAGSSIDNYTMDFTLAKPALMKSDVSDARFVDASETDELGYWVYDVNATHFRVKVRIEDNLVPLDNVTIYMYYNNTAASSNSNINNAHLVGEDGSDFSDWLEIDDSSELTLNTTAKRLTFTDVCRDADDVSLRINTTSLINFTITHTIFQSAESAGNPWYDIGFLDQDKVGKTNGISGDGLTNEFFYTDFKAFRIKSYNGGAGAQGDNTTALPVLGTAYHITMDKAADKTNMTSTTGPIANDTTYSSISYTHPDGATAYSHLYMFIAPDAAAGTACQTGWITNYTLAKYVTPLPTFAVGEEESLLGIDTTLQSPDDAAKLTDTQVNFSVLSTPTGLDMTNVTLYIWYANTSLFTKNTTDLSTNVTVTTNWSINNITEGQYIWNAITKTETGDEDWGNTNRTFTVHISQPEINITAPLSIDYLKLGNNVTLNWSITETGQALSTHIQNCSYTYAGTKVDLTLNQCINSTNSTEFIYQSGQNQVNMSVTDEFNLIGTDSQDFEIKIIENSQTFNNETIEGSSETFNINITLAAGLSMSILSHVYNGTSSTATFVASGPDLIGTKLLTIPAIEAETTVPFFWNMLLKSGTSINSSNNNQTIRNLTFDDCSTNSVLLFNYTLKDEDDLTVIPNTENPVVELDASVLVFGTSQSIFNFSQEFLNDTNPQICSNVNLSTTSYTLFSQARYFADSYAIEDYYIQNFTLNQSAIPQNIDLYDLINTSNQDFTITFKDANFVTVEDAILTISRQYVAEGLFRTIEIPKTDANGQTIAHLINKDQVYNIIVSKNGRILGIFNNIIPECQNPGLQDCIIPLNQFVSGEETTNFEQIGNLITSTSFDESTRTVTSTFSTVDGSVQEVTLTSTKFDAFENKTVCNDSLVSSSGTLTCVVPSSEGNISIVVDLLTGETLVRKFVYKIVIDPFEAFGNEGYAFLFLMLLTLPFLLINGPMRMKLSLFIVGLFFAALLNIYDGGTFIGEGSTMVWLLIASGILIYKIGDREQE